MKIDFYKKQISEEEVFIQYNKLIFYVTEDIVDIDTIKEFYSIFEKRTYLELLFRSQRFYIFIRNTYQSLLRSNKIGAKMREIFIKEHLYRENTEYLNGTYWPFDTNIKIENLIVQKTKVFDSANYPLRLTFNSNKRPVTLIYKYGDDLTNDTFILMITDLISELLGTKIINYKVIPFSRYDGIIEYVDIPEQSIIRTKLKSTIYRTKKTRMNFITSYSFFLTIAYVFGIGDRNIDNIIFAEDGNVFYIDYSYLLGKDPKYRFDFFIPVEIANVIDNLIFTEILENIHRNIIEIRNNIGTINASIISQMQSNLYKFKKSIVLSFISQKLYLEMDDEKVCCIIENMFLSSIKNYKSTFVSIMNRIGKLLRK